MGDIVWTNIEELGIFSSTAPSLDKPSIAIFLHEYTDIFEDTVFLPLDRVTHDIESTS